MILRADNPVLAKAVTIHPKMVKSPLEVRIFKPASLNSKMGAGNDIVVKGKWRGLPMFQMSLQERATCPTSCKQWASCYGNNMRGAHRIDHDNPHFISQLGKELYALGQRHRYGFVIRPHVLGDFFSVGYASWWEDKLDAIKHMRLFGFTHWERASPIGRVILRMNENERCWIRFSNQGGEMSANVEGEGIPCPQQTGKTESCLTCGVCWSTKKAVSFRRH